MANWEESKRKIQRVPSMLRDNSDVYDPKAVSFGPYHHGKPELQFCQDAKLRTLAMFVQGSGRTHEFFMEEVGRVVAYARSCYVEGSTDGYDNERFVEMMLLDACFLIFFIGVHDETNRGHAPPILRDMGRLVFSIINRDIYLVENQIPLRVVMHLINLRYGNERGKEALANFLHFSIWGGINAQVQAEVRNNEVSLMILHDQNSQESPLHIFEAFRRVLVWDFTPESLVNLRGAANMRSFFQPFRSANDLKAKGIYLKPSERRSLKSINFESFKFSGQLELPVWNVSPLSKVFFPNMIAYELGTPDVDSTVTSYVTFMKSLIENPADVKELREKRILVNTLGSDEEAAQLFRTLDTFGLDNVLVYMQVRQRIQEHYDSTVKAWIAELIHTYLSSPWAIIEWLAVLIAVILSFLNFLQTYFKIA